MADRFTEISRTGCLGNIFNSIIGALFGVVLFFASFVVLWMNEGQVDMSSIGKTSVPITAATRDAGAEGKLVAAKGDLTAAEPLGDASYLKAGDYLTLQRKVEMYAWKEKEESNTHKDVGGGSTTTKTYTYRKDWTDEPGKSSEFRHPEGHENPSLPLKSETTKAKEVKLGAYAVDMENLTLPDAKPVGLTTDNVEDNDTWKPDGDYLVNREGALKAPKVGDARISYQALTSPLSVTLFGKAESDKLVPFTKDKSTLYRAFTQDREGALATMHSEHETSLWIIRGVGFLMLWFGLMLCWGPVISTLNILPAIGNLGGCLAGVAMFGVALVLWIATVLVAMVAHNPVLLVGVLILVAGGGVVLAKQRKA